MKHEKEPKSAEEKRLKKGADHPPKEVFAVMRGATRVLSVHKDAAEAHSALQQAEHVATFCRGSGPFLAPEQSLYVLYVKETPFLIMDFTRTRKKAQGMIESTKQYLPEMPEWSIVRYRLASEVDATSGPPAFVFVVLGSDERTLFVSESQRACERFIEDRGTLSSCAVARFEKDKGLDDLSVRHRGARYGYGSLVDVASTKRTSKQ